MTGGPTAARVSSLGGFRSQRRLSVLLHGYDDLEGVYRTAHAGLVKRYQDNELDGWHGAIVALLETNLGASAIRAYLRLSDRWPSERPVSDLALIGHSLHRIGREAGSSCMRAILAELPGSLWRAPKSTDLAVLMGALRRLAEDAPESVTLVASRLGSLLASADAASFEAFVLGGLRSYGVSARRRRAYFALEDPLSLHLLNIGGVIGDFTHLERRLGAGLLALWNKQPPLRALRASHPSSVPRRVSLAGGLLRFPETFVGVAGEAAELLYRAAAGHAGAHLKYSRVRFPVGALKPLQIALISLIEDARVEALALREFPGLARLWKPQHTAEPLGETTAAALMARLARALLDPSYSDDNEWVRKGRALFAAAQPRLEDPAISREIGGLLGNDLGQMRVQFNARTYVVEPSYRDDNLGLWDFGDQPDAPLEEIDVVVDSVRVERREQPNDGKPDDQPRQESDNRARLCKAAALDGIPVASYPEWDYAIGSERAAWCTILESEAPIWRGAEIGDGVSHAEIARRVAALARSAAIGRRARDKGQYEGDTLDLDSCIAAMVARRGGRPPETRVFQRNISGPRDLTALLLLDLSESTADKARDGRSVIAVERDAATILAASLEAAGDTLAIHGFSSDGRERIRYLRIKDFNEPFDEVARARLNGLTSSHSTRLGAALRHASAYLARRRGFRRVLLVLTDGEPSDIDVPDAFYLIEDARHAVLSARRSGIDVFAFGLGGGSFRTLDRIVGERRALRVPRIETLPARVMQLYTELKK